MASGSTPSESKKASAEAPPVDVSALAEAGAAVIVQAEAVARRAARRFGTQRCHAAKGIRKGALRRLIFRAATPYVRVRRGKVRLVAPRIGKGVEDLLRSLLAMVLSELSHKAAVVAQHGKRKTLYTRDVCYAARVLLGHNVF